MLLSFERPAASRPFCATPCCGPARIGISKDSASCRTLRRLEVRALCRTLKTAQLANEPGIEVPGSLGNHRAPRNGVASRGGARSLGSRSPSR